MYKLLKFSADWCAPCKKSHIDLETNKWPFDNVTLIEYDVEENVEEAEQYSIMNLPTFVLLKDDCEIHRQVGYCGYTNLINTIQSKIQ